MAASLERAWREGVLGGDGRMHPRLGPGGGARQAETQTLHCLHFHWQLSLQVPVCSVAVEVIQNKAGREATCGPQLQSIFAPVGLYLIS